MKHSFTKLLYLVIFLGLSYGAKAQQSAVPDTTRYSFGLDFSAPNGNALNNGYLYGLGASAQVDIPLTLKWYVTGSIGINTFFAQASNSANPYGIENVKVPNMDVLPVKIGLKYFLIRTFYLQGEVGESLLLNKSALYAYDSYGLTFAPQMGLLFKLGNKKYLDVGFRYEWFQDLYNSSSTLNAYNRFYALRFAYGFNMK